MRWSAAVVAVVSVIASMSCKKDGPDHEWQPKTKSATETTAPPHPISPPAHAGDHVDVGTEHSTETTPATKPDASPDTAAVGGGFGVAKAGGHGFATVAAIEGKPMVVRDTKPIDLVVGAALQPGDIIETSDKTKVRINLTDGSILAIGPRSKLTLKKYELDGERRSGSIRVTIGSFWIQISTWAVPEQSAIEIETPNAVAGVRGTTLWGDTQRGTICALEGLVSVTSVSGKMKPASLTAGQCVTELDAAKLTPIQPNATTVQTYLDEVHIKPAK